MRVHKAKENSNGAFQIGKTWNLDDLTQIENDTAVPTGFIMVFGKPYYWNTNSPREKSVFMNSAIRIYKKYTGGKTPVLIGFENIPSSPGSNSEFFPASPVHHNPPAPIQRHNMVQSPPPIEQETSRRPSISMNQINQQPRSPQEIKHMNPQSRQNSFPETSKPTFPQSPSAPLARPEQSQRHNEKHNINPHVNPTGNINFHNHSIPTMPSIPNPIPTAAAISTPVQAVPVTMPSSPSPPQFREQTPVSISVQSPGRSLQTPPPIAPVRNNSPSQRIPESLTAQSPAPEIPTIILNNDPSQRPVSFQSMRSSIDAKGSSPSETIPSIPLVVPEETEDMKDSTDEEFSLKDLADNVIYDNQAKRSSIQSIKIFARKNDDSPEDTKSKPGVSTIKFQVHNEDGTKINLSDDEDNDANDDTNESAHSNPLNIENENGTDEDSKGENGEYSETVSLSSKPIGFMETGSASIVEETLEELNWTGLTDTKTLELNISNEIAKIESQNLFNIVDLDDKLDDLDASLANAIKECEKLDTIFAFFSVQLSTFSDEIAHIEDQGEGLQVQTRNQKVLWTELNNILHTVSLPQEALAALKTHGFEKIQDIETIERVLINLYNAVKAVKSSGNDGSGEFLGSMRALKEKRHIYEQAAAEFMTKYKAYLEREVTRAISEAENKIVQVSQNSEPQLITLEKPLFSYLFPTSAFILFVKEIDDLSYFSLLRGYQQKVKPYYEEASNSYFLKWQRLIRQVEELNEIFSSGNNASDVSISSQVKTSLKRSGTLAKLKTEFKDRSERLGSVSAGSGNSTVSPEHNVIAKLSKSSPVNGYLVKSVETIKSLIIIQQELLTMVFHLSSYGASKYPEFVKNSPVTQRLSSSTQLYEQIFDLDSDRSKAQELFSAMAEIFSPLQEQMVKFLSEVLEKRSLSCPGLLTAISVLKKEVEASNQDYLNQLLNRLYDKVIAIWNQFISRQLATIGSTMISIKKRNGPVFFVKVFPAFCKMIEQDIKNEVPAGVSVKELGVRAIVDKSYDQLGKTMIHTLQRTAKERSNLMQQQPQGTRNSVIGQPGNITEGFVSDYEDKELLNYHILMIENTTVMNEGLEPFEHNNSVLHGLYQLTQTTLRNEMDLYVKFLMYRPVGKFRSFVDDVESVYKKNANDNPATKPGLSRSSLKKLLLGYDVKELRKGLELLHKRIEKHFGDLVVDDAGNIGQTDTAFQRRLISKTWKFVEAEYSTLFSKLRMICERHYSAPGESGYVCAVEFSDADISNAFNAFVQY